MKKLLFMYKIFLCVLYLSLLVILIYTCLQTGAASKDFSRDVAEKVAEVQSNLTGKTVVVTGHYNKIIRKVIGHFLFYSVFGIVSALTVLNITHLQRNVRISFHYVIGIFLAFFTEFVLQAKTAGRSPSLSDVGLNLLGYMSFSTIIVIGYIMYRYGKPRTNLPGSQEEEIVGAAMSEEKLEKIILQESGR